MTEDQINHLITRRNKLTDRRDSLTDWKRVRRIDAQLAAVPAGQRNDVDLLLGRPCAVLPERAYVQAQAVTVEQAAPIAQAKHDEFLEWVKDQTDDLAAHMAQYGAEMHDTPKDWRDLLSGD